MVEGSFNHQKYSATDILFENKGITARDIWEKDEKRIAALRASGFEILIIWEHEHRANPDWVLFKVLAFLEGVEQAREAVELNI